MPSLAVRQPLMSTSQRRSILFVVAAILAAIHGDTPGSHDLVFVVRVDPASVTLSPSDSPDGAGTVSTEGARFERLSDHGRPELPYRVVRVLLPPATQVDGFDVDEGKPLVRATGVRLRNAGIPRNEDPKGRPHAEGSIAPLAPSTSAERAPFPAERVRYLGTGWWHGHALAAFAVFLVEVADGDLRVYPDTRVRVHLGADSPHPACWKVESAAGPPCRSESIELSLWRRV